MATEEEKIMDVIINRYATSLSQEVTEALKDVAPEKNQLKQKILK